MAGVYQSLDRAARLLIINYNFFLLDRNELYTSILTKFNLHIRNFGLYY